MSPSSRPTPPPRSRRQPAPRLKPLAPPQIVQPGGPVLPPPPAPSPMPPVGERRESLSERYRRSRGLYGVKLDFLTPKGHVGGFEYGRGHVPVPRRPPLFPEGARALNLTAFPRLQNDVSQPPPGFLTGNNSRSEWPIYRYLLEKFGPEGGIWQYQVRAIGGRMLPGGAVIDFAINYGLRRIAIRVQSERYHLTVNGTKQVKDRRQKIALANAGFLVIDIYEVHYLHDRSGRAAAQLVEEALAGRERPSPLTYGGVLRMA